MWGHGGAKGKFLQLGSHEASLLLDGGISYDLRSRRMIHAYETEALVSNR